MTNHHVGADTLAKLGTSTKDYYRDGFFGQGYEDEAKAPTRDLRAELNRELPNPDDSDRCMYLKARTLIQLVLQRKDAHHGLASHSTHRRAAANR